jgi:hypothetical protein
MQNQNSLSFLTQAARDPKEILRKVWWLLSDFDAPVWSVSLKHKTPDTIDWGVTLDDQSLLTDEKNKKLLTSLKYYLAASTENFARKTNRANNSAASQRQNFNAAIHVIDSILMNAQQFELARYGLAGMNENNLKQLLSDYAASNSIAESVYKFPTKASEFCLQLTLDTPNDIIENILQTNPSLLDISESILEESKFEFPTNLIPSIRAAMLHHGYYIGHNAAGYTVNTARIAEKIYPNTLRKQVIKSRIHILSFYPEEPAYRRELPAVPVRSTASDGITLGVYSKFRQKLCSLGILHALHLDAPPHADLLAIEQFTVDLVPVQRYRLVPSEVIFQQLKNCIEFHFKYGRLILDGYCKLARHCVLSGLNMDVLPIKQFQNIIGPELTSIGVNQLGLACRNRSGIDGTGKRARKLKKMSFYTNLRSNKGLLELISVYIGCVQFVVGVLMARRSVELIELPALKCLDKTMEWLIIDLAKTSQGLWGLRDKQARPIDKLGVQMIRELQRVQRYLKKIGFIDQYTTLFASPNHLNGMIIPPASIFSFSRNLDLLCDYFETSTNKAGQRYYIRQHQLRRFFALMFFHFFDGARINGLRWHLGHADIAHVWHYISQVVDGESLRGAKAQYVVEKIMRGKQKNYTELAKFFEEYYGITDFTLIDDVQADKYIQDLLKNGNITVEPKVLIDEKGSKMEVIVKIVHI